MGKCMAIHTMNCDAFATLLKSQRLLLPMKWARQACHKVVINNDSSFFKNKNNYDYFHQQERFLQP